MSGIVGCILNGNKNAAPILFECISKLQYRGYDSAGLATLDDVIYIKKSKGSIKEVNCSLNLEDLPGRCGISHLRWASVGKPSNENAQPHMDETSSIAIAHNGTLENHKELKEKLIAEGHVFKSQTDSEVIVHMIEKFMGENLDLEHALKKTTELLKGSYAILAISKKEPDKIVATRKESPLSVGFGENGFYATSDVPAIVKYAQEIICLKDGEIAILDNNGIAIHDKNGHDVERQAKTIVWNLEVKHQKGYEHFMIKEINESSKVVKNTLKQIRNIQNTLNEIGTIKRICFVANKSSYNASIAGKYVIESLTSIPAEAVMTSEFEYCAKSLDEDTLVVFVSKSGEGYDLISAIKKAKTTSKTLAIVNTNNSALYDEADYVIQTLAGPEIASSSTKVYIGQLMVIYIISGILSKNNELMCKLFNVSSYIDEALQKSYKIEGFSKKYDFGNKIFFTGRGFAYPTALEGSYQLIESAKAYPICFAGGELNENTLPLIDEKTLFIAMVPPGKEYKKTMNDIKQAKARGPVILSIGCEGDDELFKVSDSMIGINRDVCDIIAPLVYIVPLQLLAYYAALKKGFDPDRPRIY